MIIRIVKMTFETDKLPAFLCLFQERKELIRHFDGCTHLELWQDAHEPNVYFTYSIWVSEAHLDHYRFSDLFKDTWIQTRACFAAKPQAWSLLQQTVVH